MRVVIVALSGTSRRTVIHNVDHLLARGLDVTLVTTQRKIWDEFPVELDPRVEIRTLREGEGRHPLPRGERLLVFVLPRLLLGLGGRLAALLARRVAGPAAGARVSAGAEAVTRVQRRASEAFHFGVFVRFYRLVRPAILARVGQRTVLTDDELADVDLLLVSDTHSVPLAWQLARRHPGLEVRFSLDLEALPPVITAPDDVTTSTA